MRIFGKQQSRPSSFFLQGGSLLTSFLSCLCTQCKHHLIEDQTRASLNWLGDRLILLKKVDLTWTRRNKENTLCASVVEQLLLVGWKQSRLEDCYWLEEVGLDIIGQPKNKRGTRKRRSIVEKKNTSELVFACFHLCSEKFYEFFCSEKPRGFGKPKLVSLTSQQKIACDLWTL